MQILKAKWILSCDDKFSTFKDCGIAFNNKIVKIDTTQNLVKQYPNAKLTDFKNSIIMPALINAHTHLEFSNAKAKLSYGDFLKWLASIVNAGANIAKNTSKQCIQKAINQILQSGTASIGAISSFGLDLKALANSPLRVIYFNEIIGSNENLKEQNWAFFLDRFNKSSKYKSERFLPALAIHAPYSVCKNLAKEGLKYAKDNNLICSTHFMESKAEKQWLQNGKGGFSKHLKRFNPNPKPLYSPDEYLGLFDGVHTLFTHCVELDDFTWLNDNDFYVTHCPVSNRILGGQRLKLAKIAQDRLIIGTDGLSSNFSLSMLDELKTALLIHNNQNLNALAKRLLISATNIGAKALKINAGELKPDKLADIAIFTNEGCQSWCEDELASKLILHSQKAKALFIGGERIF